MVFPDGPKIMIITRGNHGGLKWATIRYLGQFYALSWGQRTKGGMGWFVWGVADDVWVNGWPPRPRIV
jgi:hypothetical protein